MSIVLGLDLGTNSIGWAVRDTQNGDSINQITHKGVVIFEKGVGENKGEEFSLAAQRTKLKSSRRKNQRRRWRKIDLLDLLIRQEMCPLPMEELQKWRTPKRKSQRKYPSDEFYTNWLRLDFNNDWTPDYSNPFELRNEALLRKLKKEELGRLFYHMNQRRGYLSTRSEKESGIDDPESIEKAEETETKSNIKLGKVATAIRELEEELEGRTIGQLLHEEINKGGRARRRKDENTNIHRLTLQSEFLRICSFQQIDVSLSEKIRHIIFDQRPLKSQKGTIGKCIYEKNKSRCPISHPEFELYRMWQVLNNIKYSDDERKTWLDLSPDQRTNVQEKFFRKSSSLFPFSDISKLLKKNNTQRVFNYKDTQTIAGCPTLAGLIHVLGEEKVWQLRNKGLQRIEWEQKEKGLNKIEYHNKDIDLYDLWHWLFGMDNEKDQQIIKGKVTALLKLSDKEANNFIRIEVKPGYTTLSLKAIRKINYWLAKGYKYDKSVFLANIPFMFDTKVWEDNQRDIEQAIQTEIEQIGFLKDITNIVNSLIKQYNSLPYNHRFAQEKGHQLDKDDINDILESLEGYFGNKKMKTVTENERKVYEQSVKSLYQEALSKGTNGDIAYIKPPRLENNIRHKLAQILNTDFYDRRLDRLYHPSEIESFRPSIQETDIEGNVTGKKILNTPKTDSIRNPMAMRALYELKKLINYLLKKDIIDDQTIVIVEMAKELNDANRRKAIERYQKDWESKNREYEEEVKKIFLAQKKTLPTDLSNYINRYRLREEQPKRVCIYTGNTIKDADLFDEFTTDIEHTLPRSLTFDDRMQNKTIAFKYYNSQIKNKLLPAQLPNYSEDTPEYSAIEPRLQNWKDLISTYENKIEICKRKSRAASTKDQKDKAIQDRHFYNMHLSYWRDKLERFTTSEITQRFKNSQLVDTQIISKYSVLFLKTLFNHVRSTKGILTDKIKKLWGAASNYEAKDRSKHSHHAVDAIIQTLLHKERNKPDVYNILAEAYRKAEENRWKEPALPNLWNLSPEAFHHSILQLTNDLIIYHVDRDTVLKQSKHKVRNKGRIEYKTGVSKEKVPLYGKGEGVRTSLHKATFYGAIKIPEKENGKFKTDAAGRLTLAKDNEGKDIIKYRTSFVFRGSTIEDIKKNIENIVDDKLRQLAQNIGAQVIHKQGYFEIPPNEDRKKKDPLSIPTKVFKIKVFAENLQNPLRIKMHKDVQKEHKKWYYAQTDGNYLMALYGNGKERDFELINTFQLADLKRMQQGFYPVSKEKNIRGKSIILPLERRNGKDVILRQGTKVLLYEKNADEITSDLTIENLKDRLYKVSGLSIQRQKTSGKIYEFGIISLLHHIDARPQGELKIQDGEYKVGDGKSFRKMNHNQFKALVENIDFVITPDGIIHLI